MARIASIAAALLLAAAALPPAGAITDLAPVPVAPDPAPAAVGGGADGGTPPAAPTPAPSAAARQAALKTVLELLSTHITGGKLDYHFNASGEGVCLSTAGLAFIGDGSSLGHGPWQQALTRILERVQQIMDQHDFALQPTWGCAQSAVFLAELHRTAPVERRPAIVALLTRYTDLLGKAQTPQGSWCHDFKPQGYGDLMAASVMALQGLGMARREGVPVAQLVIDQAMRWIEGCSEVSSGRIGYSQRQGQRASDGLVGSGRTAGGLLALDACGLGRSALARAAGGYVTRSFPSEELNAGHASAEMGMAWAAWWAGEHGCYDAFWSGQGERILARRMADGGFHAAPTDRKTSPVDYDYEKGDFANAFHALMLVAGGGRLIAGEAKTSPRAALDDAAALADSWGAAAPESLRRLVALDGRSERASPEEIARQLSATVSALADGADERGATAVLTLLGGAPSCQAVFDAKARRIHLEVVAPASRLPGLAKAKVQVVADVQLMSVVPSARTLAPGPEAVTCSISIATVPGQQPVTPLQLVLTWSLAGHTFTQACAVTVTAVAAAGPAAAPPRT